MLSKGNDNMLRGIKNILRLLYYTYKSEKFPIEIFSFSTNSKVSLKARLLGNYRLKDSRIDDYSYISQNAYISCTRIGKYCSIGPNIVCGWGIHPTNGISTSPMFYSPLKQNGCSVCDKPKIEERKEISIGNDVFIGANVTILDGVTIGDGAIIGAGTVVSKNVPPYAIAVGCPIRILKYRFQDKQIDSLLKIQWWEKKENIHAYIEKYFFQIEEFIKSIENESC